MKVEHEKENSNASKFSIFQGLRASGSVPLGALGRNLSKESLLGGGNFFNSTADGEVS